MVHGADALTVCRRATGVTVRIAGSTFRVDMAGAYAVAVKDGTVFLVDTVRGTVETVGQEAELGGASVDAFGSVAWVVPADDGGTALIVRDGAGTHVVGTRPAAGGPALLSRDGSTITWGDVTYTLQPRAAS